MMSGMAGGPVGGPTPQQQQMNAGTPSSGGGGDGSGFNPVKRLNTAIYDYLLRNRAFDIARSFLQKMEVETEIKKSPNSRQGGQQANGSMDDGMMDIDSAEIKNLPDDLPAPLYMGDGPFLQDWWCQFWELHHGQRGKGKPQVMSYIGAQRQAQKQRTNMMQANAGGAGLQQQQQQQYNNMMMQSMAAQGNGMSGDLKRAAMQNPRNL